MQQIFPQLWMSLPRQTRDHLIKVFELKKNGITEVRDQDVITDGYTVDDLKAINLERMCAYIGSEETFGRAWEITLAKVHSELNPPIGEIRNINGEPTIVDVVEEIEPKLGDVLEEFAPKIDDVATEIAIGEKGEGLNEGPGLLPEETKPWCDTCDSLGVRHRRECPKYVPITPRNPLENVQD